MPSQSSGPVTTFLMFVPLVAVPALAVFGIPDLKQVKSLVQNTDGSPTLGKAGEAEHMLDASTDDLVSPVRNDIRRLDATGSYETSARGPADSANASIQPAVDGHAHESPRGASSANLNESGEKNWSPPPHVLKEWEPSPMNDQARADAKSGSSSDEKPRDEVDPNVAVPVASEGEKAAPLKPLDEFTGEDEPAQPSAQPKASEATNGTLANEQKDSEQDNPFAEKQSPRSDKRTSATPTAPEGLAGDDQLTWKSAVKRLNALGIRDFQLQPGARGKEFHFSCSYAAPDQPRVTRRFEAEASEPLQAVRQVLAQVESLSGK
jgi:hypothetical protein